MRRSPLVIGALAFAGAAVASGAGAAEAPDPSPTSTTVRPTTTTSPPMTIAPEATTTTTTARPSPTTTVKGEPTTTSTTVARGPVPPPASGASQPLDPSLLGGLPGVELNPSTTIPFFPTEDDLTTTTTLSDDDNAIAVSKSSNGPSGTTLALASLAWLASLGGVLIYAEDQRSKQWRHLAR